MAYEADFGAGTIVKFEPAGGTGTDWTCNIESWEHSGISRGAVETTHMGTAASGTSNAFGARTYRPEPLSDPGILTIEHQVMVSQTDESEQPPIEQTRGKLTITFPLDLDDSTASTGALWTSGTIGAFCTEYSLGADSPNGKMMGTVVFKLSGNQTITPMA